MRLQKLAFTCVAVLLCTASASAALVHRYNFDTDTSDSVGGADGVIVGNTGSISGGQLVLDNPNNVGSAAMNPDNANPPATGAFLDLPNGIVSGAAAAGQYGAVSIEMWVTMDVNRNWSALFSAGISSAGLEGFSAGGNDHFPYLQIVPRAGADGDDFRVTTNGVAGPEGFVDDPTAGGTELQSGVEEHIIAVFNQASGLPGTLTVFRNGTLYGTANIANNLDFAAVATTFPVTGLADVNIWVGRSQWPDALLDGSVNELRIYSHALTLEDAITNFDNGPDGVPEPATCVLAVLAIAGFAAARRR